MNKLEAHELLDARKRGLAVLPSAIDQALFLTGDLGRNALVFGKGMDSPIPKEDQGGWQSKGDNMVAHSSRYYGSQAWFDVHYGIKEVDE
jgi:hypothetical protein